MPISNSTNSSCPDWRELYPADSANANSVILQVWLSALLADTHGSDLARNFQKRAHGQSHMSKLHSLQSWQTLVNSCFNSRRPFFGAGLMLRSGKWRGNLSKPYNRPTSSTISSGAQHLFAKMDCKPSASFRHIYYHRQTINLIFLVVPSISFSAKSTPRRSSRRTWINNLLLMSVSLSHQHLVVQWRMILKYHRTTCSPPTIPLTILRQSQFVLWLPLIVRVSASVKIPWRIAVRRSAYISKLAHSRTMFFVSAETSVSAAHNSS